MSEKLDLHDEPECNCSSCQNSRLGESTSNDLLPCPFCGAKPNRYISNDILHIDCPNCVSVGFHNHIRFGCLADSEWNNRVCGG